MTIESPPRRNSWNFLEPDSDSLTELCNKIGAQGIQVEKIEFFDKDSIQNFRPIHGLILLAKHRPEVDKDEFTSNHNLYFTNQVIHDAYAMHALLNIIFNCDVNTSYELTRFKQYTKEFSPKMKGFTLSNNDALRNAYNSLSSHRNTAKSMYHSISYIKVDEYVWELDGLKRGPLKLAACNENNWAHIAHQEILKKYEMYQRQKVPMSLWAVIENRKLVYQRKIIERHYIKQEIEETLDQLEPNWRQQLDIIQWVEEYNHAMNTERKKRGLMLSKQLMSYCKSFDQLSVKEQSVVRDTLREYIQKESIMDAWLQVQDELLRLYENLGLESEKDELYELNYKRKQHDYTPFIQSYIKALYEEGHLQSILDLT